MHGKMIQLLIGAVAGKIMPMVFGRGGGVAHAGSCLLGRQNISDLRSIRIDIATQHDSPCIAQVGSGCTHLHPC